MSDDDFRDAIDILVNRWMFEQIVEHFDHEAKCM